MNTYWCRVGASNRMFEWNQMTHHRWDVLGSPRSVQISPVFNAYGGLVIAFLTPDTISNPHDACMFGVFAAVGPKVYMTRARRLAFYIDHHTSQRLHQDCWLTERQNVQSISPATCTTCVRPRKGSARGTSVVSAVPVSSWPTSHNARLRTREEHVSWSQLINSFLSKLFFQWLGPFLDVGFSRPLEQDGMYDFGGIMVTLVHARFRSMGFAPCATDSYADRKYRT